MYENSTVQSGMIQGVTTDVRPMLYLSIIGEVHWFKDTRIGINGRVNNFNSRRAQCLAMDIGPKPVRHYDTIQVGTILRSLISIVTLANSF